VILSGGSGLGEVSLASICCNNRSGAAAPLTSVGIERVTGKKKIALGRPNGRYRLNELSSTSTSQIKHGAKSSPTCEHTLTKHVSADRALLAALGALSTIRHESMPMVHACSFCPASASFSEQC
jgi:ribosomal protein S13